MTRKWLVELGLQGEWDAQLVGPAWSDKVRAKIVEYEARLWRVRVVKNAKLEDYVRWKHEPGLEEYLEHGIVPQRRLWTKLREGVWSCAWRPEDGSE